MPAGMPFIRLLSRLANRTLADQRGATVVEYGLIIALIALAMVGAVGTFSRGLTSMWDNVGEHMVNRR